MRLTYTLLVVSLHKINKLICFGRPLKYKTSIRSMSERPSVHRSFYSVVARATFDALAASGVNAQLESGLDLKIIFLWFQSYSVTSALWNTTSFWLFRTAFSSKADNNTDTFQQWLIKCWCRELCVPLVSDSWCLHLGRDWINPTQRE